MFDCPGCGADIEDDEVDLGFQDDWFICPECGGHLTEDDRSDDTE